MDATVVALKGLGWVALEALKGVVGNKADHLVSSAVRRLGDTLDAQASIDLVEEIRRAQMRALEAVINDFEDVGAYGRFRKLGGSPPPFFDDARAFCREDARQSRGYPVPLLAGGNLAALIGDGSGTWGSVAETFERAVLAEVEAVLILPAGFEEHFRHGARGRPRFLDLFGSHFVRQLRSNPRLRDRVDLYLHAEAAEQTRVSISLFAEMQRRFDLALDRIDAGLARTEVALTSVAMGQQEMDSKITTLLEYVSATKGIPIAPLRAVLLRLGEENVPDDQILARLEANAQEYCALREKWTVAGGNHPEVESVRRKALTLIDEGDFEAARALFVDARAVIHGERLTRSREEATLLVGEASVHRLELRLWSAADLYAEAEALVAPFDPDFAFQCLVDCAYVLDQQGYTFLDTRASEAAIELWNRAAASQFVREDPFYSAMTQNNLGTALKTLGTRAVGIERLQDALHAYTAAGEEFARIGKWAAWASTQNNIVEVLRILAEREAGPERLLQAVDVYNGVVNATPLLGEFRSWDALLSNAGNILFRLSDWERGTGSLLQAVQILRNVLLLRPREVVPSAWASTQVNLANVLTRIAERERGTEKLEEAIEAYRSSLEEFGAETSTTSWAAAQSNLGNALGLLGTRTGRAELHEEALIAYQAAVDAVSRDSLPLDWAMLQHNLASCLLKVAGVHGDRPPSGVITSCRAALEVFTRDHTLLHWAQTTKLLGEALSLLGERDADAGTLREGIAAFRDALNELSPEQMPIQWTSTQVGLGNALIRLGELDSDSRGFQEAIDAYRAALTILAPAEDNLLEWLNVEHNLGTVLMILARREPSSYFLAQAIDAFQAVVEYAPRDLLQWKSAQTRLGDALRMLGEREPGTELLERAANAYAHALEERLDDESSLEWIDLQIKLGQTLLLLGERAPEIGGYVERAADVFRAALVDCPPGRHPLQRATAQIGLGSALTLTGADETLLEGVDMFRAALEVIARSRDPLLWATARLSLAAALTAGIDEDEPDPELVEEALGLFRDALEEFTPDQEPAKWAMAQQGFGLTLWILAKNDPGVERLEQAQSRVRTAAERFEVIGNDAYIQMSRELLSEMEDYLGPRRSIPMVRTRPKLPRPPSFKWGYPGWFYPHLPLWRKCYGTLTMWAR